MTNEVQRLRAEVRELVAAFGRGDLPERKFNQRFAERSVELYRAVVQARLAPGETIRREHHVVHSHLQFNQSILREAQQQAESLFLTEARLIRLRSVFEPHQAITADHRDQTVVDELRICDIKTIRVRRDIRIGEFVAGAVIAAAALLGKPWLMITGWVLLALGALGMVHALLLPTRWVEAAGETEGEAVIVNIWATRKKSARVLTRTLREAVKAGAGVSGQNCEWRAANQSITG